MWVVCGTTTTVLRHETPPECPTPECCTLDMTGAEAWAYWRQVAHNLHAELTRMRTVEPYSPEPTVGYPDPENPRWG